MLNADILETVIERRTLHDEVVDRMRDMIIEGVLQPGTRINETELCQRLGVSRTPVREAIKTLASEGLIDLVRNKGAIVRRLELDEALEMIEAVAVLERFAADVGVERAKNSEIDHVAALHKRMREHFKTGDRLAYYKLNQAIHTAIVALAHNRTISAQHEALQMSLRRIRYLGSERPSHWSGAMREHEQMVRALKKRDGPKLREAIDLHLQKTQTRVAAFFEANDTYV